MKKNRKQQEGRKERMQRVVKFMVMSATSQCSIKTDGTTMLLLGEAFVFLMRKNKQTYLQSLLRMLPI